jgi:hypothetical protein
MRVREEDGRRISGPSRRKEEGKREERGGRRTRAERRGATAALGNMVVLAKLCGREEVREERESSPKRNAASEGSFTFLPFPPSPLSQAKLR